MQYLMAVHYRSNGYLLAKKYFGGLLSFPGAYAKLLAPTLWRHDENLIVAKGLKMLDLTLSLLLLLNQNIGYKTIFR